MRLFAGVALSLMLAISAANAGERLIALTFDDGPDPYTTPTLLDELKRERVCATFFVVGKNVATWPQLLEREHAECHAVGNHSWSHPKFEELGVNAVRSQFARTDIAIEHVLGAAPALVRVPGGAKSKAIRVVIGERTRVDWDVDPRDWAFENRNSAYVARYVLAHAKPGEIVLLHDIRATTVAAVPAIIAGLRERGYTFVTVPELLKYRREVQASAK